MSLLWMRKMNQRSLRVVGDSTGVMPATTQHVASWVLAMPLCVIGAVFSSATFQSSVTCSSESDTGDKAALSISLKRGAVRVNRED